MLAPIGIISWRVFDVFLLDRLGVIVEQNAVIVFLREDAAFA